MDSMMEATLTHFDDLEIPKMTIDREIVESLCYLLSRIEKDWVNIVNNYTTGQISLDELHRRLMESIKDV